MALTRGIGSVHPIAILCAYAKPMHMAVPNAFAVSAQANARVLEIGANSKQTHINGVGMRGEQRKVHAIAGHMCAERLRRTRREIEAH